MKFATSTTLSPEKILSAAIASSSIKFVRPEELRARLPSFQHRSDPAKQVCLDFDAVDFIEHFVPTPKVEIVGDVVDARIAIALDQDLDSFELLPYGIFAA